MAFSIDRKQSWEIQNCDLIRDKDQFSLESEVSKMAEEEALDNPSPYKHTDSVTIHGQLSFVRNQKQIERFLHLGRTQNHIHQSWHKDPQHSLTRTLAPAAAR